MIPAPDIKRVLAQTFERFVQSEKVAASYYYSVLHFSLIVANTIGQTLISMLAHQFLGLRSPGGSMTD